MGASFGIALTLVIFAGSDLFTGHTMFMSLGVLRGRVEPWRSSARCWAISWLGNLAGCAVLAALFVAGGGGAMLHSKSNFIMTVATAKMTAPALSLFARAILCNWLVCLAIWMAGRMQSDAAKCIAICGFARSQQANRGRAACVRNAKGFLSRFARESLRDPALF